MFKVPEQYRVTKSPNKHNNSKPEDGNNGIFIIPLNKSKTVVAFCIASDLLEWEHVSVEVGSTYRSFTREALEILPFGNRP